MCYELEEYLRQRAEVERKAEEDRRRREQQPAKPADKPKEQPEPVPV